MTSKNSLKKRCTNIHFLLLFSHFKQFTTLVRDTRCVSKFFLIHGYGSSGIICLEYVLLDMNIS